MQTLEDVQPFRLAVVFRGEDACIEEDKNDNNPIEPLRLSCSATSLAAPAIDLGQLLSENENVCKLETLTDSSHGIIC